MIPGKQYFSLMLSVEKTSSKNKDAKKNHLCVSLAIVLRNGRDSSTVSLIWGFSPFFFFFLVMNEVWREGKQQRGRAGCAAEEPLSRAPREQTPSSLPNWGTFGLPGSPGTELRAPKSLLRAPATGVMRPQPVFSLCKACCKRTPERVSQKMVMLLFRNGLAKVF